MILYVPAAAAVPLSEGLWRLSLPAPAGVTQSMFPWVDDLQGKRWLIVDTAFTITVHPESVLDGIADILQPWIDAGELPAETNAQLAALIEQTRGGPLQIYAAFPDFFKSLAQTRQQMIDAGWLAPSLSMPHA